MERSQDQAVQHSGSRSVAPDCGADGASAPICCKGGGRDDERRAARARSGGLAGLDPDSDQDQVLDHAQPPAPALSGRATGGLNAWGWVPSPRPAAAEFERLPPTARRFGGGSISPSARRTYSGARQRWSQRASEPASPVIRDRPENGRPGVLAAGGRRGRTLRRDRRAPERGERRKERAAALM